MCGHRPHRPGCTLISCPACGAYVGRRPDSDYWRCDNGHTIYRGPERHPV